MIKVVVSRKIHNKNILLKSYLYLKRSKKSFHFIVYLLGQHLFLAIVGVVDDDDDIDDSKNSDLHQIIYLHASIANVYYCLFGWTR